MKPINEMSLAECIARLRELPDGTVDDACDAVMLPHLPWIFDVAVDLAQRIHDLTRWIPVEERLPTKEDANYHDEVLVCLDPMSAVNSPCLETGVEIVYRDEVSPAKHLYWKRADPPDEYHNYH